MEAKIPWVLAALLALSCSDRAMPGAVTSGPGEGSVEAPATGGSSGGPATGGPATGGLANGGLANGGAPPSVAPVGAAGADGAAEQPGAGGVDGMSLPSLPTVPPGRVELPLPVGPTQGGSFLHPGILHSKTDLDRIRDNVAARREPWYGAFLAFQAHTLSAADYVALPVAAIGEGGYPRIRSDAHAAYQNAIMWSATGDAAHAATALGILDEWASINTSWICTANIDAYASVLHFAAAAEILRYAPGSGWTAEHTSRLESYFSNVIWPVVEGAYLGHGQNGCSGTPGDGNQGAGDIRGMMAIAIFTEDLARFEQTLSAFRGDAGTPNRCVALAKEAGGYVDENGCPGEAGRDQPHPQGGVASYAEMAQMAWAQGVDLWAHAGNRIRSALEWFAQYNAGDDDVPFSNTATCFSSYSALSAIGRGQWTMTYEIAYNHYVRVKGLSMPFTEALLETRLRPENAALDDPGFGTLLFSLLPDPEMPAYDGTFKIVNLSSGKALQIIGDAPGQGTDIEQGTWDGGGRQHWVVTPLGSDYYRFANVMSSDFVIDTGSSPSQLGTQIHLWPTDGSDNKQWKLVPDAAGGVRLVARDTLLMPLPVTELGWDIEAGSVDDGASLQMNTLGGSSQRFTISSVLTPPNPGSLLATSTAEQVTLSWAAAPTASGYFVKRSLTSGGPYLTIAGSIDATSFVDSALIGGATYYYVVSANNGSGESPDSAEVSGSP